MSGNPELLRVTEVLLHVSFIESAPDFELRQRRTRFRCQSQSRFFIAGDRGQALFLRATERWASPLAESDWS